MNPEPLSKPEQPPTPMPVPPELLAWASQTFDKEEFLKGVRDIEENGGHTLDSFIAEIESVVRNS